MFVLFNVVACVGFGLLLALILSLLLVALGYMFFAPFRSQILFGIVLVVSFFILLYQSVLFVGGWHALDYIEGWTEIGSTTVSALATDPTLVALAEHFGEEEILLEGAESGVASVQHHANRIAELVKTYLWERVGWMAAVFFVGVLLLALLGGGAQSQRRRNSRGGRTSLSRQRTRPARRYR